MGGEGARLVDVEVWLGGRMGVCIANEEAWLGWGVSLEVGTWPDRRVGGVWLVAVEAWLDAREGTWLDV